MTPGAATPSAIGRATHVQRAARTSSSQLPTTATFTSISTSPLSGAPEPASDRIAYRTELNASRSSAENSSGSSQAAKCPPLSTLLK
jgi:hypothetical protein